MNHNSDELQHYGVLGMKWGVRRATYKLRSAGGLRKSKEHVEKDIMKLESKANHQKKKAAKFQSKAADAMAKGNFEKGSKYLKKSAEKNRIAQKREKTALHDKKLIKLYEKRIKELDNKTVDKGREYVEKIK